MLIKDGFPGAVGETPLIKIESLSQLTGCTILGKAEHLNPGGSVKDRAAKFMILQGEREGKLTPGKGTVVEGTAGNTGIGLALMCRARGYRCVIVMPSNQSDEKVSLLRALGAEVELVAPVPFADQNNYYHRARVRAEELKAFWANQFENTSNSDAHYQGTGPEILRQTDGGVDGFVCSSGTGGTIGGTTAFLKDNKPSCATYICDCMGSSLFAHVTSGTLDAEGSSFLEGIGIRRITANFARAKLDGAFRGTDVEATEMVHWLLRKDGLFVGGSTGLNVVGAVKLARKLGKGKTIVTILADSAARYQSRLFNDEWLRTQNVKPKNYENLDWIA
jgi:cysteine synthase